MIVQHDKPLHWAEAFGLSALLHAGFAYILLTTTVDLRRAFDAPEQAAPSLQITSLSLETNTVVSAEIGSGADSQTVLSSPLPVSDVAEPIAPVRPDAVDAQVSRDPATASSVSAGSIAPAISAAPPIAPEVISPLVPDAAAAAVNAPAHQTPPTQSDAAREPQTATVQTLATEVVNPVARDTAAPAETAETPPPSEAATPSLSEDPDAVAEDLINRIRAAVGDSCLIALPQRDAADQIVLHVYAADEAAVAPYFEDIVGDLTPAPAQETYLIDPRQCPALDYVRQTAGYPTGPVTVDLADAQIPSGSELSGRISGTGGRNVALLLVDDNGVTQNLGQYLSVAINSARFSVPLRRVGVVRDTRQLLIALVTSTQTNTAVAQNGQLAETFFGSLTAEISGNAAVAIIPFEVR